MRKLLFLITFLAMAGESLFAQSQQSSYSNPVGGNITASGSNCANAGVCVWQKLPATATTTTVTITGTFSETLIIETSADGGNTFTQQSSQTATAVVTFTTTSLTDVRVRCSAFTSGNAGVNIQTAGNQQNITINSGSSSGGGTPSANAADTYIDMNTSTPGTTLTVPILTAGTQAAACTWTLSTTPITGFTVGAHNSNSALLSPVLAGGTTYPITHASQAMAFDHTQNLRTARCGLATGGLRTTWAGFVTFGPPNAGFGSALFDYVLINDASGNYAALQLRNGNACGLGAGATGYQVTIETNRGGTTHPPCNWIVVVPGGTYWCVLNADQNIGQASLAVYTAPSGVQVGPTLTVRYNMGSLSTNVQIGQNETGTAAGSTSFFENMLIDVSNGAFPLGPFAVTSQIPPSLSGGTNQAAQYIANQGSPCTNGELALSAGWGTTATVTAVAGLGQTCQWTITSNGTGQAANPTITDTLTNPLPSATIVCDMRMTGGTGAITLINQTTLSATVPVFTFGGTPVAGSTYIVVRRSGP